MLGTPSCPGMQLTCRWSEQLNTPVSPGHNTWMNFKCLENPRTDWTSHSSAHPRLQLLTLSRSGTCCLASRSRLQQSFHAHTGKARAQENYLAPNAALCFPSTTQRRRFLWCVSVQLLAHEGFDPQHFFDPDSLLFLSVPPSPFTQGPWGVSKTS